MGMKRSTVVVQWAEGLHARPASRLVRLAQTFKSSVTLTCAGKVANLRSILSLLLLCAAVGTTVDVVASGEDEESAINAVEELFAADEVSPE